MLNFVAVGVEDTITKVGTGFALRLDLEYLVTADTKMPVSDEAQLSRGKFEQTGKCVKYYEVIAQAMHFREF